MFSILLIGVGQLGSRHLQGLITSKFDLKITVVDPSLGSLKTGKLRWTEAGGEESSHTVRWLQSFPLDLLRVDVVFVLTSSKGRAAMIEKIAKSIEVKYWVLEKVLAQSSVELELIKSALNGCDGAWVNIPRRVNAWHQLLKVTLADRGLVNVSCSGGLWGLASNSIHIVDLVAWWSGESLIFIDTSGLDNNWFESKRAGYFEVTGDLVAHFSLGTTLRLSSKYESRARLVQVSFNDDVTWVMNEKAGTMRCSTGQKIDGRMELQSQQTGRVVDDILQRGKSELPALNESCAMHSVLLDAMLAHWNRSQNRNDDCVPIT